MEQWRTYTLEELTIGKGTYGIGASAVPYDSSKYTYLRITDINDDGTLNKNELKSVDDVDADKYVLQVNDIVFARTGNSTGRSYFYDGSDGVLVYAGFLIKFSLDPAKVNPRIMKYYTHSQEYYDWVKSFDTGGTRGNINAKTYGSMPITLPPRDIQDKIVEVLKSLDEKIELNKRINDNLEQQAQALYKSWFVDFEPFKGGEFIESEIGEIPAGWSIVKFGDIVEIPKKTINPQKFPDTIFNHYSLPACDNGLIAEVQAGKDIMSNKIILQSNTTLFSKLNPRIKRIWFTCEVLPNSICSTEFIPYRAKIDTEYSYIFSIVNSDAFYSSVMGCVNGATGSHQRFHAEDTEDFLCAYNKDAVNEFSKLIEPVLKQMHDLRQENVKLALTRDTLLPKLMSGELKINEIDC